MQFIPQIIFVIVLVAGIALFTRNIRRVIRNIKLGRPIDRMDNPAERWAVTARIALGQSKMVKRPVSGFIHIIVYLGFIVINIEVLEILIDGVFGTHRIMGAAGPPYNFLIGTFEVLAFLVLVGVIIFWTRRNITNVYRFMAREIKGWPKRDADYILYFEMVLMMLFLVMNATDYQLQLTHAPGYYREAGIMGSFPISQFLSPIFEGMSTATIIAIERAAWWLHIIGILIFLNYLYYSKHLHIILAFPNVYLSKLTPQGKFDNLQAVTNEVKLMMDPDADPYATPEPGEDGEEEIPEKFGASDVMDLNQVQLLNAYTCTECGRCTAECPANQTGKKLSPRKIMMDTRDRLEEVGNIINKEGKFEDDGKKLLDDYILREELWACTTCNACVEACPIGIDPLSIILDMRRYLVMEESAAPQELAIAMTNIENNGAPWPYNQMDRLNWAEEK